MGKTPKPLQIWVDHRLWDPLIFQPLIDQGHLVVQGDDLCNYIPSDFDLMLGMQCWRMTNDLLKHLPLAIRGARDLRYRPKPKPSV